MKPADDDRDPGLEPWIWKQVTARLRSDSGGDDRWIDDIDADELSEMEASLEGMADTSGSAAPGSVEPLTEAEIAAMVAATTAASIDEAGREDDATILPGPGSTLPAAERGTEAGSGEGRGKVLEGPSRWTRLRIGAAAILLVAAGVRFFPSVEDGDPDGPGSNVSADYHTTRMTDPTATASERRDSMIVLLGQAEGAVGVLKELGDTQPEASELVHQALAGIRDVASGASNHATPDDPIGTRLEDNRQALKDGSYDPANLATVVYELAEDCERVLTRVAVADFSDLQFVEEDPDPAIAGIHLIRSAVFGRIAAGY